MPRREAGNQNRLDAELRCRVEAEVRMAVALLELERRPGYRLLESLFGGPSGGAAVPGWDR